MSQSPEQLAEKIHDSFNIGNYILDNLSEAVLKRGVHGTFHHVSKKHLDRYVDEFTFRLNAGKVSRHTTERLDSFIDALAGKRITYAQLTTGKTWFDADAQEVRA